MELFGFQCSNFTVQNQFLWSREVLEGFEVVLWLVCLRLWACLDAGQLQFQSGSHEFGASNESEFPKTFQPKENTADHPGNGRQPNPRIDLARSDKTQWHVVPLSLVDYGLMILHWDFWCWRPCQKLRQGSGTLQVSQSHFPIEVWGSDGSVRAMAMLGFDMFWYMCSI